MQPELVPPFCSRVRFRDDFHDFEDVCLDGHCEETRTVVRSFTYRTLYGKVLSPIDRCPNCNEIFGARLRAKGFQRDTFQCVYELVLGKFVALDGTIC